MFVVRSCPCSLQVLSAKYNFVVFPFNFKFKRVEKEPILCFAKSLLWGSNVYSNCYIDIKSYFLLTLCYLT